jgi:hypothetical protein
MNKEQEKEAIELLRVLFILWTGTFSPKTWAVAMERVRVLLDKIITEPE